MTPWLTAADIATKLTQPGRMDLNDWRPVTMCAVILAESGGNPQAVGKPVTGTHGTGIALGLAQLLTSVHVDRAAIPGWPRLTVAECFDPDINLERAWQMMNVGRTSWTYNMTWWTAYNTGAYKTRITEATLALRAIGSTI